MSYTTLPSVSAGDTGQSSWANLVRSDLEDHEGRLAAIEFSGGRWTKTATQAIPDSSTTNVSFGASEAYDAGGWGLTSSNTTITVPAGAIPSGYTTIVVDVGVFAEFANDADGRRILAIHKNGTTIAENNWPAVVNLAEGMTVHTQIDCVAGDTFTVAVTHTAGANLDINKGALWIARRAPVA